MFAIHIRFLTRRYHATKWGSAPNEGVIDWPPSPHRIVRALAATAIRKHPDAVHDGSFGALIDALGGADWSYALPAYSEGHTRHYVPRSLAIDKKSGGVQTTRLIDAHVLLGRDDDVVVAYFDTDDIDQRSLELLQRLTRDCPYLGRAESWVEMRVITGLNDDCQQQDSATGAWLPNANTWPVDCLEPDAVDERGLRTIELLELVDVEEFVELRDRVRAAELDQRLARKRFKLIQKGKDASKVKATKKDREAIEAVCAESLGESLFVDSAELQQLGWERPPGARLRAFALDPVLARVAAAPRVLRPRQLPTRIELALSTNVLPTLVEFVFLTEKIRRALLKRSDGHPVFLGRDKATDQRLAGHQHAHFIPGRVDAQGRVHGLSIYAPMGFDADALRAIGDVFSVWQKDGDNIELIPTALIGPSADEPSGDGPYGRSKIWTSVTPFVCTRHAKSKREGGLQVGSPAHDLVRLLREQGFPELAEAPYPAAPLYPGGRGRTWLDYRTERRHGGGRRGAASASGFQLVFREPVQGPIALGYGAHFGLGAFAPAN